MPGQSIFFQDKRMYGRWCCSVVVVVVVVVVVAGAMKRWGPLFLKQLRGRYFRKQVGRSIATAVGCMHCTASKISRGCSGQQ